MNNKSNVCLRIGKMVILKLISDRPWWYNFNTQGDNL